MQLKGSESDSLISKHQYHHSPLQLTAEPAIICHHLPIHKNIGPHIFTVWRKKINHQDILLNFFCCVPYIKESQVWNGLAIWMVY